MHETVAKHHLALVESRAHDVMQVLDTCRSVEESLAHVVHFLVFGVQYYVADLLGNGTAAELTGEHNVGKAHLLAILAQFFYLVGFAYAVTAFKSNKILHFCTRTRNLEYVFVHTYKYYHKHAVFSTLLRKSASY